MPNCKQGLLISLLLALISNSIAANFTPLSLQQSGLVIPEAAITTQQMPRLDNALLLQHDQNNPTPAQRFSETQQTWITPKTHGSWETIKTAEGIKNVWRMTIQSTGAVSLNLAITKFHMPEGGKLFIYAPGHQQILGPYTQKEATTSNKLWTPIIFGDTIIVEVNLPKSKEKELILEITRVNHGYKSATAKITGACNIDVACPAGDAWQDQIRSTVMFTFQSLDPATGLRAGYVCSGSMVNNTAQDNTPYLLTANHCEVDATNSDTVVVYWNYQNSQCRKVNSATNANPGNGSRSQSLVGGSSLIANYAISDFRLLKLVKSIPADYNVFYAGWDRSQLTAPLAAASIHHPNGEEKRISLVTDPSLLTLDVNQVPNMPKVQDSHIRILFWTAGTTEGGSSGAPLFDQNQRIVGQLSGGSASCANLSQSDWYGRLNLSWVGNITNPSPSSRLSDWLDPNNTGVAFINGKNANNTPKSTTLENSISQLIAKAESKSSQDFTITIPTGANNLRISASGVISDADLYVKFASKPTLILYDERSWSESSNETIFISTPETGIYFIKVYGYTEYSNLTLTASYNVAGSILKTFKNSHDTTIIDTTTTSSTILSNYNNNVGTMKVIVNIKHTDINDISITLIAPNKTKFVIKNTSSNTVSQNFNKSLTFTIPAGIAKGQWTLEVQDNARLDSGYIDYWELSFP